MWYIKGMAGTIGVFLVSAAMLLLQLALVRLFAVQQFYHFAFMAISLALLGNGASGSLLSLLRRRVSPLVCCLGFSLTALAAFLVINNLPFDSYSIAWDRRQGLYLAIYFFSAAIPFLFSGLLIGGALMHAGEQTSGGSHTVYAANLTGSAAGSIGSLWVIQSFGGAGALVMAALLGLAAGIVQLAASRRKPESKPDAFRALGLALLAVLALAGVFVLIQPPAWMRQNLSPYKALSILLQMPDARHSVSDWDAGSRVDVVESDTIHIMPGLSLLSSLGPPPQAGLTVDGDQLMPITQLDPDSKDAALLADSMPVGAAYRMRPGGRTLVIGAGTGLDVLLALAGGASRVTAVDDNRLILDVVEKDYAELTGGLYRHPRVRVVNQLARVYVRQPHDLDYDLVVVSLTDPHRPVTSGAYSLTENYTYTVEAVADYLNTLAPHGLLVVTRWLQTPPSECGRAFAIVAEALRAGGLDPAYHTIAYRSMRTATILASPQTFEEKDIAVVRQFLERRGFDWIYYPGIRAEELNRYNILPEDGYHQLFTALLADPGAVYRDYPFDIRPSTDDQPFFFHYFRWRQTPEILATLGLVWQPFGGSGFFVLVALLLLVMLASALLIIAPVLLQRTTKRVEMRSELRGWRALVYFGCLGLAFLFVEISLAQRFILLLGKPVIALAVVFFSILLCSGLGSLTMPRWSIRRGLGLLVVLAAVYPLLVGQVAAHALRLPEWGRVLLAMVFLAPLGYLMGLPFAAGLRVVERMDARLVAWAWAINGSFSVISAVLAVMIAMSWGFSGVLWLGALAYAAALGVFFRFFEPRLDHSSSRVSGTKRT